MSATTSMHLVRPGVSAPGASSTTTACNVKIHATAFIRILEIVAKQSISKDKRIIGTLLGYRSDDGSGFEVRDAFMVPCDETGDSIAIADHEHKVSYQLYKKAHPKESVLGWFGTSKQIDNSTGLIHDFYSKGSDRAFPYPAIYLNVNYRDENDQVINPQVSTYIGSTVGKVATGQKVGWKTQSSVNSYVFHPIPNQIMSGTTTEKLALDSLVENHINQTPTTFSGNEVNDLSNLKKQINIVVASIDKLAQHLDSFDINNDNDLQLLRTLTNNLSSRPQSLFNLDELKKHFGAYNQDVIMIEYLTKVVKEQIELSARLTATAESEKKDRE
ncbi:hypothetical protein PSN45_002067 [Yamadazyma tenuis]|uniref:JAB1/MPN/MOV34 metalloenzyme domain-containing protein n=1 Tax=Candida tenuis (strain ATCC 10573 / BCRC 21748 / CBS 615 / JCM 9827 / NBRC 10315 / NRRL Y-1498 / VKM Y-70) TaxID=590646 RepID=G3BCK7_CANTC|nr:uncharacterized protein CANTEDRAFT_116248 [Yamadazyma tenuis ATCC 10573]XP_006690259.1 uncharacterized protein CANTEDRAFT_116248 [Yamadazyma tenuis ATCC 10573]EGV61044.1 hypothetical protein CANTEDRAFT_116248 [Yamadazyma tenuis ATCC 10573]EGV61045.1 hypothetical protein CANTEDRAFT_116248 [Yamadazyma tenuis ATCC 10573]WEJ94576.1 hypothetical protein PSN45_002067 [Yamadazyma tenuis]